MAVKVLISRRLQPGALAEVLAVLSRLRAQAMAQPGYITGETLKGYDDPNQLVVISTWEKPEHWRIWKDHPDRRQGEAELAAHLSEPAQYQVFLYGGAA